MRNTILGTLLLLLCISCKKEDPKLVVDPGIRYYKEKLTPPSPVRLFANTGEVRDASILSRFASLDSNYAYDLANSMAVNPSGFLDTLRFESQTRAVISRYSALTSYDVTSRGIDLLLTGVDTLYGSIAGTEMSRNIKYFVPDPQIILYDEYISGVSQGFYYFTFRFQDRLMVRSGGAQSYDIPFLLYSWYRPNNTLSREFITGALQSDFYKHIPNADTVAIREYKAHFTK